METRRGGTEAGGEGFTKERVLNNLPEQVE